MTALLAQMRRILAANEAITEPLWSIASGAADLVRAADEIEDTGADLQAGAVSPENAKRRLGAANQRHAAARSRVIAGLEQLRARISELGGTWVGILFVLSSGQSPAGKIDLTASPRSR